MARPRYDFRVNSSTCVNDSAVGNSQALPAVEVIGSPLDALLMVINYCIVMVALVILHGASTGLSLFNIWVNTIHCLVVPSVGGILTYRVMSFNICPWAPTILSVY